ncbi:hypothetical protein IAT38_004256 [Cryptococcus sp. DSM 104549]
MAATTDATEVPSDTGDILQNLIKEGLSGDGTDKENAPPRLCKLIRVLLENCVLKPIDRAIPPIRQDYIYTITILQRQTALHPGLLLYVDGQVPFYQWLLPRMIYAATKLEDAGLVDETIAATVHVMYVMGTDVDSPMGGAPARGPGRTVRSMEQMLVYCQDILDGIRSQLYNFADLASDAVTLMTVISIIAQLPLPFAARAISSACTILSQAHRMMYSPTLQIRYAHVVALACQCPASYNTAQACAYLASLPPVADQKWLQALTGFYEKLESADVTARDFAWQAVYQRAPEISINNLADYSAACHLLTPILPSLSSPTIKTLLGQDLIKRWSEELQTYQAGSDKLQQLLDCNETRTAGREKRKRVENETSALTEVQTLYPDLNLEGEVVQQLLNEDSALSNLAPLMTKLVCACAGCHQHTPSPSLDMLSHPVIDLWIKVNSHDLPMLTALSRIIDHTLPQAMVCELQTSDHQIVEKRLFCAMRASERANRTAAGRIISNMFALQAHHPDRGIAEKNRQRYVRSLAHILQSRAKGRQTERETAILVLGEMGRHASGDSLCSVLQVLLKQLGSTRTPMRSLAYTQLVHLAKHHNKTPYNLLSPFLKETSILLASNSTRCPEMVAETLQFIGFTRQGFFEMTLQHTLPALVIAHNSEALHHVCQVIRSPRSLSLMDNMPFILSHIFLHSSEIAKDLNFLFSLSTAVPKDGVGPASLIKACIVDFLVQMVVELGDQNQDAQQRAKRGLEEAKRYTEPEGADLGAFLKPSMLGVISQLNDMLHDVRGKKSVEYKRKIIQSLGALISLVGDSLPSFSPQIMASLQSTLVIQELQLQTLKTWQLFISTLRFVDVGPFLGRTTGALVANWRTFDTNSKHIAISIVNNLADDARHLTQFLDEVVGMDHIPELQEAAQKLTKQRRRLPIKEQISKVLDRVDSKNSAISTASLLELRLLITSHQTKLNQLVQGDTYDPIISRLMASLLSTATRDGDFQKLRDLSYECIGILGALDPDRLGSPAETGGITLMSNFSDHDESIDFALHLIQDLLVDAYRGTNDTKHQKNLVYAIQELLKFCGFSQKVIHSASKVDASVRARWESLPKDQLETLTPLLESHFSMLDESHKTYTYPIYNSCSSYREWLQYWSSDLVAKILQMEKTNRAVADSQAIFGVFRAVLRDQDVTVAHHILPHLVLNVLLSGNAVYREEIRKEIVTVLQDLVNPTNTQDRRSLSAQVVFDLMDHLSKWLRAQRVTRTSERGGGTKTVEKVLSGIDTHIMAQAALKSKAYARSLRSYEELIIQLRNQEDKNTMIQTCFENLHHIYAELEEPDGMEGVSTYVISPSMEHQIREHESTGRWTSAQSCWEVQLQRFADDVKPHVGLLKCLRNLGHYDTLRTHIRGVISHRPDWSSELAPFAAEAAWLNGDWDTVQKIGPDCPPIGQALLALHKGKELKPIFTKVRRDIGSSITGKQYAQAYEALVQLHLIQEVTMISTTKQEIESLPKDFNKMRTIGDKIEKLTNILDTRFLATSPAFRTREAILSVRRTAYSLINTPYLKSRVGDAWNLSSKIARKAGYEQTAYSAALQAAEVNAQFAFIQQAKLRRAQGSTFKALAELDNGLATAQEQSPVIDMTNDNSQQLPERDTSRALAKARLLAARWAAETDRFEHNEIVDRFTKADEACNTLESIHYHWGHYYDSNSQRIANDELSKVTTAKYYYQALQHGVKYIYQTMPRMLTLWLDFGQYMTQAVAKKNENNVKTLLKFNKLIEKAQKDLPAYQFLTAFPQIVSRIVHPNRDVARVVRGIIVKVISEYPQQALWPVVGVMQSRRDERKKACREVLTKIESKNNSVGTMIKDAERFSHTLLKFTDDKTDGKKRAAMSIKDHYPYVTLALPTKMILPLQDALTCTLPSTSDTVMSHNPFPNAPVEIHNVDDRVEIMPSLQRPKKLVFIGSDGKQYPFLCKPHDDLRKDARLMDFNSMINKLLKSASESRRRQLYIRTYAVMPLNEECGLLEWVSNTHALKKILDKGYERHGKKVFLTEVYTMWEVARKQNEKAQTKYFVETVLPIYTPTVFHEWFLLTWPEPSAWLASRMAYARTLAVMSMIGFVLGLGDRHGENILFDGLSGDTVHVDLNCLFDKGKTFEVPERVPFRLTHNMVDALGVTGVEGVFRNAAEITMGILRSNSDSMMSVLEAFVHDPLVEWTKPGRSKPDSIRSSADKNLEPIKNKLRGILEEKTVASVSSQVETLIKQATSPAMLGTMYVGWAPWL